jgi:hypothetical protein
MSALWAWVALFGLGAYHGINPGMGWLFAVALGLQAVLAALPPIALGHALSVGVVILVLWVARASVPAPALRVGAAAILFGFGLYRLVRSRHPARVGMRVGFRDLTLWSFVMATAHGAGLMLVPVLLGAAGSGEHAGHVGHPPHAGQAGHAGHMGPGALLSPDSPLALSGPLDWLAAVGVHTAGHLLVAGLIALLVYERFGLAILKRAWFNLDLLWVIALMVSGLLILIL